MSFLTSRLIYHGLHLKLKTVKKNNNIETIVTLFYKLLRSIISLKLYIPSSHKKEHYFYVGTNNQKLVLEKIYTLINEDLTIYFHGSDVDIKRPHARKYPFWLAYLSGLIFYFFNKRFVKLLNGKLTKINPYLNFDFEICLLIGFYYTNILILKLNKPKYIWLSNDHTHNNVSFIYAAKKLNIKTIYIQHASVSNLFPPLYFDYVFLDGEVAYEIYKKIGIAGTKVYLTGNPKLDGYINKFSPTNKFSKILVCINRVDNIVDFEDLIDEILNLGIEVKLRKHPYLNFTSRNEDRIELSKEFLFMDALPGISLVIAGDSNVHLEATICNVPSMYLATSSYFDYYGFVKNQVVIWSGHSVRECIEQISRFVPQIDVFHRAKPYFSSIDTEFQNKSAIKIINIIDHAN